MHKKSKTIKRSIVGVFALTLLLAGVSSINADTKAGAPMNRPEDGLITALATRFSLSPADIQKVFDDVHAQMKTQHLTNAVTAGKLTQAQADLIKAKQSELESLRASFASLSAADKKTAMKTHMESLKTWATQNNIPKEFILMKGGKNHPFKEMKNK